jgi:hypothetical protein
MIAGTADEERITFPTLNRDPMKDPCYQEAVEILKSLKNGGMDAMEIGKVVNFLLMLSRRNIEEEALLEKKPEAQGGSLPEGLDLKQKLILEACVSLSKFTAIEVYGGIRDDRAKYFNRREAYGMLRHCPFVRRVGYVNKTAAYVLSPETVRSIIAGAKL